MAKQNIKKGAKKKEIIPSNFQGLFAILTISILLFIFFWGPLTGGGFIDFDNLSSLAFRPFIEQASKKGEFPLWTPLIFSGMPAYASLLVTGQRTWDIIAQIITNFSVGFGGIFGGDLARVLFFYILYGIGIYWLMRYKNFPKLIALFSSFAAIFSTYVITWVMIGHNTKPIVVAMFPYTILFFEKLKQKFNLLDFGLLTIAFAIMFIGNHLQMIFYGGLILAVYIIYDIVAGLFKKEKILGKIRAVLLTAVSLGFAFLMSADRYFSTFEYAPYSVRGSAPIEKIQKDESKQANQSDYEYATMWSISPEELFTFLVPSYFGFGIREYRDTKVSTYWGKKESEDSPPYMGILVIGFAILGLIFYRKETFVQALFIVILLGIFLSFGKYLPFLYNLFYNYFPSFSKFRAPSMALILVHFSIPILAGYGLKSLINFKTEFLRNKRLQFWLVFIPFLFLLLAFFFSAFMKTPYINAVANSEVYQRLANTYGQNVTFELQEFVWGKTIQDWYLNALFLLASAILAVLFVKDKVKYLSLMVFIGILTVIDLFRIDYERMEYSEKISYKDVFAEREDIYDFIKKDQSVYRIADFSVNPANLTAYYLVENINGYHAAKLRVYQDLLDVANMEGMEGSTSQLYNPFMWNLLNVKYIIFNRKIEGLVPIYQGQRAQAIVYPNPSAFERAFFVRKAVVAKPIDILYHLKRGDFNPRDTVFVEKPIAEEKIGFDTNATASIIEKRNDYIKIKTQTSEKSLLFLSEVYYPYWRAYIDGKEVEIIKANYAFRAVVVPSGEHILEMKIISPGFEKGKTFSLLANVITLVVIAIGIFWNLQSRKTNSQEI
ncbi:MAG: YfhO family protein [Ignavibacteria bacterium]|nr:YfhO family protein [Ignavibacteria bacterium]